MSKSKKNSCGNGGKVTRQKAAKVEALEGYKNDKPASNRKELSGQELHVGILQAVLLASCQKSACQEQI